MAFVQSNAREEGDVKLRVCPGLEYECFRSSGVVSSGSQVEILQARWFVYGTQGCYFYQVREPGGSEGWLAEDCITPDLTQPPHPACFVTRPTPTSTGP